MTVRARDCGNGCGAEENEIMSKGMLRNLSSCCCVYFSLQRFEIDNTVYNGWKMINVVLIFGWNDYLFNKCHSSGGSPCRKGIQPRLKKSCLIGKASEQFGLSAET